MRIFLIKRTSNFTENELEKSVGFMRESGIFKIFKNKLIKNVVDYGLGIEVELDIDEKNWTFYGRYSGGIYFIVM